MRWYARRSVCLWLLTGCLVCLLAQTALAQSGANAVINREHTLKALFIYNFGSYVEWPADAVSRRR